MPLPPEELDVETLAQLLCAADRFVNDGDSWHWKELDSGRNEYRKMARFLLRKAAITARNPEQLRRLLDEEGGR